MGDSMKLGNSGTGFGNSSFAPSMAVDTTQYGDAMDWKAIASKMKDVGSAMQSKSPSGALLKAGQTPSVQSGPITPSSELPDSGGLDAAAIEKLIRLISRGK